MKTKKRILITIPFRDTEELQRAKAAVLYHLETLEPDLSVRGGTLTVRVVPIDPSLFYPEEARDIIRLTLAQSLTFIPAWTCELEDNQ